MEADVPLCFAAKTFDNCPRFSYKLNPLPVHFNPTYYLKKAKNQVDHGDAYNMKVDGLTIENGMSIAVHPLFCNYKDLTPLREDHSDLDEAVRPLKSPVTSSLYYHALQLPMVLNYFERQCFLKDLNWELFSLGHSPFILRRNTFVPDDKGKREDEDMRVPEFYKNFG